MTHSNPQYKLITGEILSYWSGHLLIVHYQTNGQSSLGTTADGQSIRVAKDMAVTHPRLKTTQARVSSVLLSLSGIAVICIQVYIVFHGRVSCFPCDWRPFKNIRRRMFSSNSGTSTRMVRGFWSTMWRLWPADQLTSWQALYVSAVSPLAGPRLRKSI